MSTVEVPTPRLKTRYEDEIRDQLMERFELKSVMAVPRVSKVTLNMGVGEAKVNSKALDDASRGARDHQRAAPGDHPRDQVDRRFQAARGHAHRLQGDAAGRPHVRVSWIV